MVTIRLPRQLRRYASDLEFVEAGGATVLEVLQAAVSDHPDLLIRLFGSDDRLHPHLAVFYEQEHVHRDEIATVVVANGDRVDVVIGVSGGAGPKV